MASSKTTTKKTATKGAQKAENAVEQAAVAQQQTKRKVPAASRRVPVQYTPRIPTARCPRC